MGEVVHPELQAIIDRVAAIPETMSSIQRRMIFDAAMHVLDAGTPGLTPTTRKAIASSIAIRVQHGLSALSLATGQPNEVGL
jgi:hypothetical protein